jgi:enoyl-CoA hydratase/carnithine racemase
VMLLTDPMVAAGGRLGPVADRVTVSVEGGVADVRLNRPDKINALDPAMFSALVDAGEALKGDGSVRAVVLSGEGRGFCAGLDFISFQAMAGDGAPAGSTRRIGDTEGRITHLGQQAAYVWQEVPAPVIAAIHGVALGGGIQIALGADLRFVTPDARMSVLEIRWGLVPDMTGTLMLPRVVGLDVAKELTFTGRMVSGEEAGRLGLATRVTATPLDDALALARELAGKSPSALRGAKRLLNASGTRSVAEQFAAERVEIGQLIGSPDQVEAVSAYFEKREPVFRS